MTVSTTSSTTTVGGDGANIVFNFSFIAASASAIEVIYTDATGGFSTLPPTSYTLALNPPAAGQIWGVGGSVTYPLTGSPIASGTTLTISRVLPYTQTITIANQGDFAPQVIEEMGDTLEMQMQQIAARTTQFRGAWLTNTDYTVGDIVQDGANGANTGNYYICAIANTSGTWTTDLADGDWAISVVATVPSGSLTLIGDVTGNGLLGTNIVTTIGTNKVTNAQLAQLAANTVKANITGSTASVSDTSIATVLGNYGYLPQDFRLTLTTGLPVTTGDVTGATTIYCTPYKGNRIALYDGSANWNIRTSSEFSLPLGTLTSGKPYDVFCYDNAGVPTLEFLVWTNDTTRATALVYQNGILVKSGATTRRYLGTFYTTSTTQTEDSSTNRYLYNYYNRVKRFLNRNEATATWNYTLATWRQANAAVANQLNALQGYAEDAVYFEVNASVINSGNADGGVGIGFDSTTAPSSQAHGGYVPASAPGMLRAVYRAVPTAGRHAYVWLEISQAAGTATWQGTNTVNGVPYFSGISGEIFA